MGSSKLPYQAKGNTKQLAVKTDQLKLLTMGSPFTTIAVGILLSIFISEIIAETPLDEKGQIDRNNPKVKELLTKNNLDENESFRCGVFFAGKKYRDKPFQKLFILPKRFSINTSYVNVDENNDVDSSEDRPKRYSSDASCPINNPYGTADVPSVHNDTCFHIFKGVVKRLKLEHDSFDGNEGKTIGDDTCATLVKLGIKRLPPNKRFKEGITIGFYYNMCSDKTWYDTGLRLPQNLCCVGKLSDPSYKACEDFDKE